MNRGSKVLLWAVGAGAVFILAIVPLSAKALQVAQVRADERWSSVMRHWTTVRLKNGDLLTLQAPKPGGAFGCCLSPFPATFDGGNAFREWKQCTWNCTSLTLVLRQERNLFGSHIEGRVSGFKPLHEEAVRAILGELEIDLVVEP